LSFLRRQESISIKASLLAQNSTFLDFITKDVSNILLTSKPLAFQSLLCYKNKSTILNIVLFLEKLKKEKEYGELHFYTINISRKQKRTNL